MRIKNIYGSPILFEKIGYELQSDEDLYIYELGGRDFIKQGSEEIINQYIDRKIQILYNDGTEINDFPTILSILNGDVSDVNITSVSSNSDIVNVDILNDTIASDEYYYFTRKIKLAQNQAYKFSFKGYMKTFAIRTEEANIIAYIDNPRMSGFEIDAFSETQVELDYKKKDLVLKIIAKEPSILTLFCDGIYRSEDGKTKEQFIKELESKDNISEYIPEELKGMIFNIDLQKDFEEGSNVIVESALGQGIRVYNESDNFHNNRYIPKDMYFTCGNILTMQYGAEHSLTAWVKFANKDDCYILDNYEQFYIKLYKGKIYASVRNTTTVISDIISVGQWYVVGFTADDNKVDIYLNGGYAKTIKSKIVQPKTTAFYLGQRHNGTQKFDGELGKIRMYNYKLSAGMIAYIAQQENPTIDDIFMDEYKNGLLYSFYDISNYKQRYPNNHYEYTILEKEFARPANLISTGELFQIDSDKVTPPKDDYYLTIVHGILKIYTEGNYVFAIDGGDAIEFILDDSEVIGWYDKHDMENTYDHQKKIFLTTGEHKIKFRHQEITGTSSFKLFWKVPDSNDFELVPNSNLFRKKDEIAWSGLAEIIDSEILSGTQENGTLPEVVGDSPNRWFNFRGKNDYISINNVGTSIYNNVFRVSMWIKNYGEYAYLVCTGGAEAWNHHFFMYLSGNKLHVGLYGEEKSSNRRFSRNEWVKIDFICDGVNGYSYINGVEDKNLRVPYRRDDYYESSSPRIVFNRVGDLSRPRWMDGEFGLGDFVFSLSIMNQKEIEHTFNEEKGRYTQ